MLFDSPIYFVFLALAALVYWRLSHRRQNVFLLLASYFFYGWWDWRFLALMIGGTAADFFIAHKVVPGRPESSRLKWLVPSLILIFTALIRKCVIADNCALLANAAFGGQLGPPNFWVFLIGVYAFAWQVYGDFSGYTDIARGSAQLLGFQFVINFRQPYLSQSLQEFWRRWHITLSTWLRDYVYIPLGGSRCGNGNTYRNLFITMLLAGLWHGANWTYVVFGAIHGLVMAAERFLYGGKPSDATTGWFVWPRRILTFNILCLSFAFFRARSLSSAVQFLAGLSHFAWRSEYLTAFVMLSVFSLPLFLVDLLLESSNHEYPFAEAPYAIRTAMAAIVLIVLAILSGTKFSTFVYFQF